MTEGSGRQKPVNTKFKQQQLPFIRNNVSAGTVAPIAFIVSMVFTPMGLGLLFFSNGVQDIVVDYTDCCEQQPNVTAGGKCLNKCANVINPSDSHKSCECQLLQFEVKESIEGKVSIYYALTNFHQNHRRYLGSRDLNQLKGLVGTAEKPIKPDDKKACMTYNFADKAKRKIYFPCGSMANSMFSDEITLFTASGAMEIPLLRKGIAWNTDKKHGFNNPPWFKEAAKDPNHKAWKVFVKPPSWGKQLWQLDPADPDNNGLENEDFIVWMKPSAFPSFRKLYRIVDHDHDCQQKNSTLLCSNQKFMDKLKDGLPRGNYTLKILYSYPVTRFGGTKSVIISSNSLIGGGNFFLAYAHILVGILCLVIGIILLYIHFRYGDRNVIHTLRTRSQQVELKVQNQPQKQPDVGD